MKLINTNRMIVLVLIQVLVLTSCNKLFLTMYGLNENNYNLSEIKKIAIEDEIDINYLYKIDESYNNLKLVDSDKFYKAHQPLQVLIYDSSNNYINEFVNCDFQGFPNIDFNKYNNFDDSLFERKGNYLNRSFNLIERLPYITRIDSNNSYLKLENKMSIIVFYSNSMGRQKKRLFELIKKQKATIDIKNLNIVYINMDLFLNTYNSVQ